MMRFQPVFHLTLWHIFNIIHFFIIKIVYFIKYKCPWKPLY